MFHEVLQLNVFYILIFEYWSPIHIKQNIWIFRIAHYPLNIQNNAVGHTYSTPSGKNQATQIKCASQSCPVSQRICISTRSPWVKYELAIPRSLPVTCSPCITGGSWSTTFWHYYTFLAYIFKPTARIHITTCLIGWITKVSLSYCVIYIQ